MSLLNEMLKDLHESKPNALGSPPVVSYKKRSLSSTLYRVVIWFSSIFCLSLLIVMLFHAHVFKRPAHTQRDINQDTPHVTSYSIQPKKAQPLSSFIPAIPRFEAPIKHTYKKDHRFNKVFKAPSLSEWHDLTLNRAQNALEEGSDEEAILLFERILSRLPAAVEAREQLAMLYLEREQMQNVHQLLDEGLKLNPESMNLSMLKARLLFEQEKSKDALDLLRPFHPDIHLVPDFYGLLAAVLQSLGRLDEAGSLYQLLIAVEPSNGQYWLGYGMHLERQQAKQQAVVAYRRVGQSDVVDPVIRAYAEKRLKILQG